MEHGNLKEDYLKRIGKEGNNKYLQTLKLGSRRRPGYYTDAEN